LRYAAERLIGRETELARLDKAWKDPATHVVSIVAWGGVGKTALAAEWMTQFAARNWDGVDAYFDWSFYSQGTREQGAASTDTFLDAALRHFGAAEVADSAAGPEVKGSRLAELVAAERTLLILDGLEPLQHGPGPVEGQLKDPGLSALLRGLAQRPVTGLCLATTREKLTDLNAYHRKTVDEWTLEHLSDEAGAELLHRAGANRAGNAAIGPGDAELRAASCEVGGHALTLHLLGRYLALAHGGDIRRRDLVDFQEADNEIQGGHAFRVIDAYERWLLQTGEAGERQVAVLRLLGLFDRPADPGCLAALRAEPVIAGLTDPLIGLTDAQWNLTLSRLEDAGLLTRTPWHPPTIVGYDEETAKTATSGLPLGAPQPFHPHTGTPAHSLTPFALDAHPLLRERFARKLADENPNGWREAHRRLYEHLKASVPYWPEGLDGLQPLYQAVAHGCGAERHGEAFHEVFWERTLRNRGSEWMPYSTYRLGAVSSDLAALRNFVEDAWHRPAKCLSDQCQFRVLGQIGYDLRAMARLQDAYRAMVAALDIAPHLGEKDLEQAAIIASNLSTVCANLTTLEEAAKYAERSVGFARECGNWFRPVICLTFLADCLHQAGKTQESVALFREAEALQRAKTPHYPYLYTGNGFRYLELLLAQGDHGEVLRRLDRMWKWRTGTESLYSMGLYSLARGEALRVGALAMGSHSLDTTRRVADYWLSKAIGQLVKAGREDFLPRALLARAALRATQDRLDEADQDLSQAQVIAERGPMRLHMADIQLTRARLFHDKAALAEARGLIEGWGYHRRDGELADAEEEAERWPAPEPDPASTPASTADPIRGSGIAPTPGTRSSAPLEETTVIKTIVELDLIGYSDKARELQENLGAEVVMQLNEQIQALVDAGLDAAGVPRNQALLADTGDGGMLLFDEAAAAHRFAQAAHRACEAHNQDTTLASAQRWFRIGIATGEVAMKVEAGTRKVAGIDLSNVVRLETAGTAGHILIDADTYDALPGEFQSDYVGPEEITGKRNERFQVYRCIVTGPAPGPAAPTVMSILDLFDALNPRDQLHRLMILLKMPQDHRPPDTLTPARRQDQILDWACGQPDGTGALDQALRGLIARQSHPQ